MTQKQEHIAKGIDTRVIIFYYALVFIGLIAIFSVEYRVNDPVWQSLLDLKKNYARQVLFIVVSSLVALFILLIDSKFFTTIANLLYFFGLLLMLLTFVIGKDISGSKSWIVLGGGFNLQPAELCKIFTSLALAKYLSRQETEFNNFKSHLIGIAIVLIPAVLAIAQKEVGLSLVYFSFFLVMYREGLPESYLIVGFSAIVVFVAAIVLSNVAFILVIILVGFLILFFSGRRSRQKGVSLAGVIVIAGICIVFKLFALTMVFDKVLKPHHSARIYALFGLVYEPKDPVRLEELKKSEAEKGKKDVTYNVRQSKIAIGSGGLLGKGFLKGVTTQGDFVPAQHTDFIFSAIAESFGFWGSAIMLGLYLLLLMRIITIAERQRSTFSRVYAYSVASILFFHVFINICMTIGLMPVIGITLPLLSYGGSSLITFTTLIFILLRLDANRQMVLR
jgi:rod shape determining protein RodA